MTGPPGDPFGPLGTLLGYVMAILGIAMLIYAIRQITALPVHVLWATPPTLATRACGPLGRPTVTEPIAVVTAPAPASVAS
jgi:hypothetical protein